MYLLDTNILSELIRARPHQIVAARFQSLPAGEQFMSVISLEEIRFGALTGPSGNRLLERTQSLVLPRVSVAGVDQGIALLAASIRADRKRQGKPVGYADGLIAATAKHRGLILAMRNVRDFDDVAGLNVENWFDPPEPG